MDQYEMIRTGCRVYGQNISEMARLTGHSRNTIKKAIRGEPWGYKERSHQPFPVLDKYLTVIDGWLKGDKDKPKKQRHTAHRVYDRLVEEPGYIWHITHRCHKREFLLKFSKDRQRYLKWLYQARKRYGLKILNYAVTSNHIHLLVADAGDKDVIPNSMQLIAGRSGQEYNQRKKRKGAYWEDRYTATAVENGDHLARCMVYMDTNMVRAGVVSHPSKWSFCGYNKIQE